MRHAIRFVSTWAGGSATLGAFILVGDLLNTYPVWRSHPAAAISVAVGVSLLMTIAVVGFKPPPRPRYEGRGREIVDELKAALFPGRARDKID